MKYAENIRALDKLKPDMTGFIFHPSSPRFADAVPEYMPASSLRVGVFVNSDTDYILYKVKEFGLNLPESDEYQTIGGLILHEFQSFPKPHEIVNINHFHFKIIKVTATKIELVKLKVMPQT